MNEQTFVDKRRHDWGRLEELVEALEEKNTASRADVRELLRLYRRAASDLAEAQTHFPATSTLERLQVLVGRAYSTVYRQPEERLGVSGFLLQRLPRTFRENVGYFIFALATFAFACVVGATITGLDERWAELFLPPAAIKGVQEGHLWTDMLFSVVPSSALSALVFYNNALVCFTAFAAGIFFGVGTLYVLFANGLMLGSVMSLCWRYDMLGQLGAFAVGHGVLEISAIMLAATAGLMLGDALIRPGRYRRLDALRVRARDAVTLAVGAVPFLALAGFIEGFVSPGDLQQPIKYALGLGSGSFMYLYLFMAGRERTVASDQ